jgi:glycosyltransferase involved in cell wall biosynthesis
MQYSSSKERMANDQSRGCSRSVNAGRSGSGSCLARPVLKGMAPGENAPGIRIAFYVNSLAGGGAERATVRVANGLQRAGFSVDLVLGRKEGPYIDEVADGVNVVELGSTAAAHNTWRLWRYVQRAQPVALVSTGTPLNVRAVLVKYLATFRLNVVLTERNMLSHNVKHARRFRNRFFPLLVRLTYQLADNVVAVSNAVADDLVRITHLPLDRIQVIYNPVITPDLWTLAAEPVGHAWFEDNTISVVLGVGRLHPQKDFTTLLHAFSLLDRRHRARLVILGEGPERDRLIAAAKGLGIQDAFDLPGFVPNPLPYFARARVFVLSSAWEGLPAVLIQALACGCSVVSTDCAGGIREILKDGAYGELVPVGDAMAMASAMARALEGHGRRPNDIAEAVSYFEEKACEDQYARLLMGFGRS